MKCGYPDWAISKAKEDKKKSTLRKLTKQKTQDEKSEGLVAVPYIEGLSEKILRVLKNIVLQRP